MEKHSNCAGASGPGSSMRGAIASKSSPSRDDDDATPSAPNNQQSPINNPGGDWFTLKLAEKSYSIKTTFLHWVAAHGAMCLGLRHPQMTEASRQLIADVIDGIEQLLKAGGMPQEQLNQIHLIESEEIIAFHAILEDEGDRARRRVEHLTREALG